MLLLEELCGMIVFGVSSRAVIHKESVRGSNSALTMKRQFIQRSSLVLLISCNQIKCGWPCRGGCRLRPRTRVLSLGHY